MIERNPTGDPEIKVLRPLEEVQKELRELADQYWDTKPASLKSVIDDFNLLLYEISGGRLGKASIGTRLAETFEEATDITITEARMAIIELREKYEKKDPKEFPDSSL